MAESLYFYPFSFCTETEDALRLFPHPVFLEILAGFQLAPLKIAAASAEAALTGYRRRDLRAETAFPPYAPFRSPRGHYICFMQFASIEKAPCRWQRASVSIYFLL